MMRKLLVVTILILGFFLAEFSAHAFEGKSSKTVLDNGLTVLISEMPTNPMVSVYALVKTGSATEGKFLGTGISHFLEHMLFKGTNKRKVGEIAAQVQAVGGTINAATSFDYTIYTINVPYEEFDLALDILSDMLMNSVMDPKEVESEREVIFSEMRLHNDNPARKLSQNVFSTVYLKHTYQHPIIGYESLLRDVTRQDLLDYYHLHYSANNTIVSIAGNIQSEEILAKVKDAFGKYHRSRPIMRNLPLEQQQISLRRYEEEYPTDLTRLAMAYASVPLLNPDLYPLDVLAKILGHGKSSRLYKEIYIKQGLVHRVGTSNYTPMDKGIFEIECILDEDKLENSIEAIKEQIEGIKKRGVTKDELEKARRQVLSEYIVGSQTTADVAGGQATDEAFAGDHQFSKKYVEGIQKVTLEDIQRVSNQYLYDDNLSIVVLRPQNNEKKNVEKAEVVRDRKIQKHTLDNGLTVLLKEDQTFPLTSMRLVLQGGTRQEEAALTGISKLTGNLWARESKSFSSKKLAEMVEGLGMRVQGFSGRNSFGLNMQFLSQDLNVALKLLDDLIKRPTFPEQDLQKLKEQMKTALRARDDNISKFTSQALRETLFKTHPFRLDPNGTNESIDRMTREDVLDFYRTFAVPNNMVLAVFGDINAAELLPQIKKQLGTLKEKDYNLKYHTAAPLNGVQEQTLSMKKEQAMVMFGFHGVPLGHEDYYGVDVMSSILGSSFSGRMFSNIREKLGKAYTLGGSAAPGLDAGFIYFYVLTDDASVEKVKELLKDEIKTLQTVDISEDELNNIKTYLKGTYKAGHQTNAALSFTSSLDELYGLGYLNYQEFDESIDRVSVQDIKRLANTYLDLNHMAIVVTRPEKESALNESR